MSVRVVGTIQLFPCITASLCVGLSLWWEVTEYKYSSIEFLDVLVASVALRVYSWAERK